MESSFSQFWMIQGSTALPNALLRFYKRLQLTAEEVLLVSYLMQEAKKDSFPIAIEATCEFFSMTENELFKLIQHLMDRQCLSVTQKEQENGRKQEFYSLAPLFQQLEILYRQQETMQQPVEENLLLLIEKEFGRTLSSFEIQTIASWQDQQQYSYELIVAALKEAVLNQVFTLNYMDKILLTWQRKGLKTVQQVIVDQNRTKKGNFTAQSEEKEIPKVPLVNWLE